MLNTDKWPDVFWSCWPKLALLYEATQSVFCLAEFSEKPACGRDQLTYFQVKKEPELSESGQSSNTPCFIWQWRNNKNWLLWANNKYWETFNLRVERDKNNRLLKKVLDWNWIVMKETISQHFSYSETVGPKKSLPTWVISVAQR